MTSHARQNSVHNFNTIGVRTLCTRSLFLEANIRFPVVQGAYCADRTGFAAA